MTHVFRYVFTGPTGYQQLRSFAANTLDDADTRAQAARAAGGWVDARLDAIDGVPVPEAEPNE